MKSVKIVVSTKISEILKQRLEGENLSQIARELGISKSLLADWVASRRLPSLRNIEAVDIREEKYGYDLKHFPCLELKANHAFGLIAMAAHNVLRWTAIHENPGRPRFSKGIRNKFIHVPGIMVSHARLLVLRVSEIAFMEVNRLRESLGLKTYGVNSNTLTPIPTG